MLFVKKFRLAPDVRPCPADRSPRMVRVHPRPDLLTRKVFGAVWALSVHSLVTGASRVLPMSYSARWHGRLGVRGAPAQEFDDAHVENQRDLLHPRERRGGLAAQHGPQVRPTRARSIGQVGQRDLAFVGKLPDPVGQGAMKLVHRRETLRAGPRSRFRYTATSQREGREQPVIEQGGGKTNVHHKDQRPSTATPEDLRELAEDLARARRPTLAKAVLRHAAQIESVSIEEENGPPSALRSLSAGGGTWSTRR